MARLYPEDIETLEKATPGEKSVFRSFGNRPGRIRILSAGTSRL